ncbi:hypothetical protein AVEN_153613-1 [Araneus ventricosus]|uniref:Uncharacterized protein n=1 Tax=Araneus ventricosus TaxID=182803 RepID=A0A4Y2BQ67_ARAVE|nr:hypothetical protein AVEN_153613-1 [Araneus ventricosus]
MILIVLSNILFQKCRIVSGSQRQQLSLPCGEVGEPLHYAISCPFTASFHLTKPIQDLETVWWNKVMNDKLSRIKTMNLVNFLLDNEFLLSPDPGSEQFLKLYPSSTHLP